VPSNSQLRTRKSPGISAVPPYHPDYEPPEDYNGKRYAEDERGRPGGKTGAHVRHGSEGYEVRPVDRESQLADLIASRGQEEGHYRRYVPESPSESESNLEGDAVGGHRGRAAAVDVDDDEPLALRVEKWRSGEAMD